MCSLLTQLSTTDQSANIQMFCKLFIHLFLYVVCVSLHEVTVWLADTLRTSLLFVVENVTSLKDAAAYFTHTNTYTHTH